MTNFPSELAPTYTVFSDNRQVVSGPLSTVLPATKRHLDSGGAAVLIFTDQTGRQVDFDFSGTLDEVLSRTGEPARKPGPGRPRLGVVSREVSLLPRQWEWLESQPNGISAALRRIVDDSRRRETGTQRARRMRDAIAKFMWAIAGDFPGFEEATRALYAGDDTRLSEIVNSWPDDIRSHLLGMVAEAGDAQSAG